MKTTYPPTYLWLLAGLLFATNPLLAQTNDSYKQLGWVERSITVTKGSKTATWIDTPTPEVILRSDKQSRETAEQFEQRFPGRGRVRLTNDLLKTFDDTKGITEGVHLFLGLENGQFVPTLVHTDINRETMPDGSWKKSYYEANFSKAYVWQPAGQWSLVQEAVPGQLKTRIRNSTNALTASDISRIKGYYLSKDALVKVWKRTGKNPLTLFFLLDDNEIHLALPYCSMESIGKSSIKAQLFYTNARVGAVQTARKAGPQAGGSPTSSTPTGPTPGSGPVFKAHGSVRCCPSYCGGLDVE